MCSTNDDFVLSDMEVWELVGTMVGSLSQCLVSNYNITFVIVSKALFFQKFLNRTFPLDNWKAGRKLHLDRAAAYLMQVQTNIG